MKNKKLNKKLTLNKKTISNLNNNAMQRLKGAGLFTDDDHTCFYISCLCETNYTCCTCGSGNPICICESEKGE